MSTAAAPATSDDATPAHPDPGFAAAVRSEWIKLWTARSPRRNLILGAALSIAMSALLALVAGATYSDWSTSQQLDFDPVLYSFPGAMLASIFFISVGVKVVTAEYDSQMIRLTFTATPQRDRVLFAKALVVAVAVWIFSAISMVGMLAASQAIFAASDLSTAGLTDGDTIRLTVLLALFGAQFPLLGLVAGFLLRSTAAAITATLAVLFVPAMFGALFPLWWQENVLAYFPGSAADALTLGDLTESTMYLSTVPALIVTLAWVVVPLGVTRLVLLQRDA